MKMGYLGQLVPSPNRWGAEFTWVLLPQQGAEMNSGGPGGVSVSWLSSVGKEDSLQEEAGSPGRTGGRGLGRRDRERGTPWSSLPGSLVPATPGLPWGPPKPWWRGSPEKQWREGLVPVAPSEQSRQGTCHLSLPCGLW